MPARASAAVSSGHLICRPTAGSLWIGAGTRSPTARERRRHIGIPMSGQATCSGTSLPIGMLCWTGTLRWAIQVSSMPTRDLISQLRYMSGASLEAVLLRPYRSIFGEEVRERFAIVGNARTGSNYLLDGLKSSKSVKMYHEIFAAHNREIGKDFDKVFSTLFRRESKGTRLVGFKLFYNHLTDEEWERFLSHRGFKVIHLTRENRV